MHQSTSCACHEHAFSFCMAPPISSQINSMPCTGLSSPPCNRSPAKLQAIFMQGHGFFFSCPVYSYVLHAKAAATSLVGHFLQPGTSLVAIPFPFLHAKTVALSPRAVPRRRTLYLFNGLNHQQRSSKSACMTPVRDMSCNSSLR